MAANNNRIEVRRGDNRTLKPNSSGVVDENGNTVNLTGATIRFSVKKKPDDTTYIIRKKSDDPAQIDIINPIGGIFEIYLLPADTEAIKATTYEYDIQITTSAGKIYTIVVDKFVVLKDVTKTDFDNP